MRRSKKGQARDRAYKKAKIEHAEELKAEGKWVCIFTGEPLPDYLTGDRVPVHHLLGRDGDLMCDKKFFGFYYHSECHTQYHENAVYDKDYPEKSLCKKWWWNGFMARIKEIDSDLWYHLYLKQTDC